MRKNVFAMVQKMKNGICKKCPEKSFGVDFRSFWKL